MSQKKQTEKPVCLSEQDYLATLDIITQFNQCETRKEIKTTLNSVVLPYLKAQSCSYFFSDVDIHKVGFRAIDNVNVSESDALANEEILSFDPLIKVYFKATRPIISIPTDLSIQNYRQEFKKNIEHLPDISLSKYSFLLEKLNSGMIATEGPNTTMSLSFLRMKPHVKPFSLRDIRKLELLRPHFLNTIKTVALREELAQYQSLVEVLQGSTTAIALVHFDMLVLYSNPIFTNLFSIEQGQHLPNVLGDLIEKESNKYSQPVIHEDSLPDLPFYTTDQGVFRLGLDKVEGRGVDADECWLIRLKPAIEPYTKMNYFMQVKGLTQREMEICILVKDGMDNQDIADRLLISPHTAKTHLKNIYEKMEVNSRTLLDVALSQ